ncbi:MAG: transcriptional regulator [Methylococcaceae bacterium NSO1]|jgi:DeoR family suf operon transcriptional repressor|nr:MAG: transcriptional regulator [Methylococcaceae bacterium NSO1]
MHLTNLIIESLMLQNISLRQHHILQLLLENRVGLSIDALAKVMDISRAAVQQHLVGLEGDGYIKKNALNKTAGRPVVIYGITDKGINYFPKQYAWFSDLILSELRQEMGAEGFKDYMQRLGIRLANSLRSQFEGKNLNDRIEELLLIMANLGFQVTTEIESESSKSVIRANNCIYHDLAQKHIEICAFDLALMSSLLDKEVKQLSCMAKGDCACRFRIQEKQT